MIRVAASLLFLMISTGISGQQPATWSEFLREAEGTDYFLLTLDPVSSTQLDKFKVLRKLDESHFIVSPKEFSSLNSTLLPVNNDWKLYLNYKDRSGLFYVVGEGDYMPAKYEYKYGDVFVIKSDFKAVQGLKEDPEVISISNNVPLANAEARVIDLNLNPNRVNKVHHLYPTLNGEGEIVSIQENYYREDDIDLLSRNVVTGFESEQTDQHAEEMATIIAGAGNSFITGRGVAKEAAITSSDFAIVLPDPDSYYAEYGINTQNHSYGIPQDTAYLARARAFDESAYNHPYLLHVFSSGNEGASVPTKGKYADIEGFANLTGDIKMSKNSLVVGSVDTVGNEIAFVSRGPTYDGRIKPEVVAYSVVGSSNSAALVSGVSVLLQQRYKELVNDTLPAALTKALLINSAMDVGAEGLDFVTGYGSVNAWSSLQAIEEGRYLNGSIANGEKAQYDLTLPDNAVNLKVTLCWTDPPANVGDAFALVNDLDLSLKDESDQLTLPWVLNPEPTIDALSAAATHGEDHLNNVEQVTIERPGKNYTIEVNGLSLQQDQAFYIVYQFDLEDTFEWDFPTGSDNMPYNGETGSYFRWTSSMEKIGTLSYSVDGGTSWELLSSDIPLPDGQWRWNDPPTLGDSAIARMEVDGMFYETDVFTLSSAFNVSVGFNCADSTLLTWPSVSNASTYTIFVLGSKNLEEYVTTGDTALVINDLSTFEENRFAIQPNLSSRTSLLPTPTFDINLQGIDCYVFSFFQTVKLDTGIVLNLNLGTTYGVEKVIFQRNVLFDYVDIVTVENPDSEFISFLDSSPTQGYNEHRAMIQFINGETLTLSAGTSFYLTEVPVLAFPTVLSAGDILNVVTAEFEDRMPLFELIDSQGSVVYSKRLEGSQDFIEFSYLSTGIYYYRIHADGNVYSDRILVR